MRNAKCEPCTFSQEPEADCLPTSSSDTRQLSLLSGSHTPAKSCENELPKDGSPPCTCGKGTSDCSIHPNTPEAWTAFMRASLVRILALPENKQALERKRAVASTVKSSASLAWFDPVTCSLRMSQQSLLTDSEPSSLTLPRSGMTLNGYVYELPIVGRITCETDGGFLPTPVVKPSQRETTNGQNISHKTGQKFGLSIAQYARMWPTPMTRDHHAQGPSALNGKSQVQLSTLVEKIMWQTPTAHNAKECGAPSELERNTTTLAAQAGGKLNPTWVGWLMGFPIGYTNSRHWVTPKSRCKPQSHGDFSEANEHR